MNNLGGKNQITKNEEALMRTRRKIIKNLEDIKSLNSAGFSFIDSIIGSLHSADDGSEEVKFVLKRVMLRNEIWEKFHKCMLSKNCKTRDDKLFNELSTNITKYFNFADWTDVQI